MALNIATVDICFYYQAHLEKKFRSIKIKWPAEYFLVNGLWDRFCHLNLTSEISTYVKQIEWSLVSLSMSAVTLFSPLLKTKIEKLNI